MKIFEILNKKRISIFFNKNLGKSQCYTAFTLAEVLITLGIIGVVAAMTIPTLINTTQEIEYKTAYKAAYSDISQAFSKAIYDNSLTPRIAQSDQIASASEWAALKNEVKITRECEPAELYSCWKAGDVINTVYPDTIHSSSFIDISGRTWAQYYNRENIYLVDTNGFKPPNRFGKDRWIFVLRSADGSRANTGLPAKVGIVGGDVSTANMWCQYPPCYYKSWLYNL